MKTMKQEIHDRMTKPHSQWEGDKLKAYICPAGFLSVGRGHNCVASPVPGVNKVGDRIDRATLERLYEEDCAKVFDQLDRYFSWWPKLGAPRAAALFDMVFNMGAGTPPKCDSQGRKISSGNGVRSFVNTLQHMQNGNYAAAAAGMMASKWARQVGDGPGGRFDRAEAMSKQMETGAWQV